MNKRSKSLLQALSAWIRSIGMAVLFWTQAVFAQEDTGAEAGAESGQA